jgi:O-antigen/teichoic acid export membrane protein
MFGDFIVSFKNLSLSESGVYFALSLFCKFIFISYIYINRSIVAVSDKDENKEEKVLDIFYKNLNGMLSLGFVIFVLFFILSKYLIEIFFGESYVYYQTSLPFIMVANIALLVALLTYETAKKIDKDGTKKVLKIFVPIFTILFIFMTNGYVDTVAYFVIGGCSILSIFLYNFVIKRPSYIQSTYNYLF